jgi:DNA polymerase-1
VLALIDGDIVAYRCAASAEADPVGIALIRAQDSIEQMLAAVGANEYQVWLSDKRENNYRRLISPDYKANRDNIPKPIHLDAVRQFLLDEWQANVAIEQEADDALGIEQTKAFEANIKSVICSIDKDLKQIPGQHYNFVKLEFDEVDVLTGIRYFYKQLLIGDRSDNILGVHGIGPKKADAALNGVSHIPDMYEIVRSFYNNDDNRLLINGKLLWIRRKPNEMWEPPVGT